MHRNIGMILDYKWANPYVDWPKHQIEMVKADFGGWFVTGHRRATIEEIYARKGLNPPKEKPAEPAQDN